MATGYVIEMLPMGESIWQNVITTMDGKPVTFEEKEHAETVFGNFRPHFHALPPGQIRVQPVEINHGN